MLPRWPRDEGTLASYVQVKLVVEKCTKLTVIFIPPEAKCRVHYLAIVANFARTGVAVRSRGAPLTTPGSLLQAAFLRKWLG